MFNPEDHYLSRGPVHQFEGCFSEFIEIDGKNKIYPEEALQFIK